MKKVLKISALLLILMIAVLCCFVACDDTDNPTPDPGPDPGPIVVEDYASQVTLDLSSSATVKAKVIRVHQYIDGDTTHFEVDPSITVNGNGILKARYLAINTPESTGKIEDYGHMASRFTKDKLSNAADIYIESDTATWNLDSTGGRHLVWVWYRNAGETEYRNLNIEILQNGLAIASNTSQNRYGTTAMAALNAAKAAKLYVHSGVADPEVYRGGIQTVTLKELRTNTDAYNGVVVAVEGIVTTNSNNTVNIESLDPETGMCFGFQVYYGYNLSGAGIEILNIGNKVMIVGTVQYYESGKTWQISDLQYREFKPSDPKNIQLIEEGHSASYTEITADQFKNGKVDIEIEDGEGNVTSKQFAFAECALNSSVSMKNLKVKSIYTTSQGESKGAMTLTCEVDGITISVRTLVLRVNGELVTADAYKGKTINVKGIVDYFDGDYQIKVHSANDITIL